jgi:hypothetical protein
MESSSEEELEDDFPGHEWITPQSSIRAAYQSQTEKVVSVLLPSQTPSPFLDFSPVAASFPQNIPSKYCCDFRFLASSSAAAVWSACCRFNLISDFGSRPGVATGNLLY